MIDKMIYITKNDNEKIPLIFSFNVIEKIQEKYGSYNIWTRLIQGEKKEVDKNGKVLWVKNEDSEPDLKALKFALTEAINEGIDIENESVITPKKFLSEKQVGRLISEIGLDNASKSIQEAVIESQKIENQNEDLESDVNEDESKN